MLHSAPVGSSELHASLAGPSGYCVRPCRPQSSFSKLLHSQRISLTLDHRTWNSNLRGLPGSAAGPTSCIALRLPNCAQRRSNGTLRAQAHADGDMEQYWRDIGESELFASEVVQQECDSLMAEFRTLSTLRPKFPDFDIGGKEIFIVKMEDFAERLRMFTARCKLSESTDRGANQFLQKMNVQLLNVNTNLDMLYDGVREANKSMRSWVEEEKEVPPSQSWAFRDRMKRRFNAFPDISKLMSDPTIAASMQDPMVMQAVKDVMENPQQALIKYQDNPNLIVIVRKFIQLVQEAQ